MPNWNSSALQFQALTFVPSSAQNSLVHLLGLVQFLLHHVQQITFLLHAICSDLLWVSASFIQPTPPWLEMLHHILSFYCSNNRATCFFKKKSLCGGSKNGPTSVLHFILIIVYHLSLSNLPFGKVGVAATVFSVTLGFPIDTDGIPPPPLPVIVYVVI